MNTQVKAVEKKRRALEEITGSKCVERVARRSMLEVILGFFLPKQPDVTLEEFEALERRPTRVRPAPYRDHSSDVRWHL